ncbi:MAG: hypothetical protein JXR37_28165 [Kiritimatiellae bacterium]|nr:hypothetical protein [Kiritimatiellia bacterium]
MAARRKAKSTPSRPPDPAGTDAPANVAAIRAFRANPRALARDLANLLLVVRGYTEFFLRDHEANSGVHASLRQVLEAVNRAEELCRTLHDSAEQRPADVPAALEELRPLMSRSSTLLETVRSAMDDLTARRLMESAVEAATYAAALCEEMLTEET